MAGFITPRVMCNGDAYVKPTSGLHVEDLPGFGCNSIAAVEPGKYGNAQTFINEKLDTAGKMILDRMRNYLEPYVQERGTKEAGFIGTWGTEYGTGVSTKVGVRVRVDGGPMLVPSVPRLWIQCEDTIADLTIYVKDGNNVHEFPATVTGGGVINDLWLNFEPKAKTVDIYVTDDRFKPLRGDTQGTKYFSNCAGCSGHGRYRGIAGGGLLGETEGTTLQGIMPEVVLLCSIDPVACLLLKRFRFAVLYQFGILVLEEWLATSRLNYFAIHSKEWAAASLELWNTVELPRHMKTNTHTLASFISQLDPDCLECGTGGTYTHAHP